MAVSLPDVGNGLFEALGGIAIWQNVRRLSRDKCVRGTDWKVTAFFTLWGLWNLFYYPALGQWYSFFGGIPIAAGNLVWVALALKYRKR